MAGHSKWSTIKRHKQLIDNKKSKIFNLLSKEIFNICSQYGPNPKVNFKLRNLINKAKLNNMPNIKIEESINRAVNCLNNLDLITYEAYGPYGVGFIIQVIVNNNNKNNINLLLNNVLKKYKGHISQPGEVIFNFNKTTKIILNNINKEIYNKLLLIIKKNILIFDYKIKENYYEILIKNDLNKNIENILKQEKIFSFNIINNFFIPKYFIYINKQNELNDIVELKNELKNIQDIKNIFSNEKYNN